MRSLLTLATLAVASFLALPACSPAQASPLAVVEAVAPQALTPPVAPVVALGQAAPAVGPGFSDSFAVLCTSAAAISIGGSRGMFSYTCQNPSTVKVAVGDSGITDPGTSQTSPVYCLTNCPSQEWGGDIRLEYCRGDTDTTIYCRAMVGTAP